MRKIGEEKNSFNLLEENFLDIFEKYNDDIFNNKDSEKDQFFNLIKSDENKETEKDKILNADDIFYIYLKEFYPQTNKEYLHFLMKFIIMFRQCLNKLKDRDTFLASDTENYFTQKNNLEGLPDYCNEFIMDFMELKEYFGK